MDGERSLDTPKRGRGRPRKKPLEVAKQTASAEAAAALVPRRDPLFDGVDVPDLSSSSSMDADRVVDYAGDIEAELQKVMDGESAGNVLYDRSTHFDDSMGYAGGILSDPNVDLSTAVSQPPVSVPIKKMTKTSRKFLKFGYCQLLRCSEPLTGGRIPGERAAYILANDKEADGMLDEILKELDEKYKVEQYFNPESKLGMFTIQLIMQAKMTAK